MRAARWALAFAWIASLLAACRRPAREHADGGAGSERAAAGSVATGLATPTAFALTPHADAATLVFAPSGDTPGAIVVRELDALGAPREPERSGVARAAVHGRVTDLAAQWLGERLVLGWVERVGSAAEARAAWDGREPVHDLGPAWDAPEAARGNLAVAARADKALLFARGAPAPCIDPTQSDCFGFSFHELGDALRVPSALPLSVPVPCTEHSTLLAVAGTRWHYGVCTSSARGPVTTLFTIEPSPAYARADTLLAGCTPLGLTVWDEVAWLTADCQGERRAARVAGKDEAIETVELRGLRLACSGTQASIHSTRLELALREPRGELESLLPAEIAPPGARAVWTGRALLVATNERGQLRLTRRTCEDGVWREASHGGPG